MSSRSSERGSAMLITMVLISAILAGAAVLVSLQMGASRNTEITRVGISALYCAEAGLRAARATVENNQPDWALYLGLGTEPTFLASIDHDIDNAGSAVDFTITLEDDWDEVTGPDIRTGSNADKNSKIFVVSRCNMYPDFPREVRELLYYQTQRSCYNAQKGGCGGNGNMNQ